MSYLPGDENKQRRKRVTDTEENIIAFLGDVIYIVLTITMTFMNHTNNSNNDRTADTNG